MRAELIAVGTELLLGSIANTDGAYLSRRLAEMGIDVMHHTVVGDNVERLQKAVRLALSRADIVILSGGLGPTTDDITKEAVAQLLSLDLKEHTPTIEKIRDYYTKAGREITELSLKQGLIPHGAIVFENTCGTAPGMCIESDTQSIIILPGPPRELETMFENAVAPYLKKYVNSVIFSSSVYIVGKGEPYVEEKVGDLIKSENPTFALYAKDGEVQIRVTSKASNRADAIKIAKNGTDKLLEIFGQEIYGVDSHNIQTAVVDLLCSENKTVTTAESLTGGMISSMITGVSGASNVFKKGFAVYCDKAKHEELGVKSKTLKNRTAVSKETAAEMAKGARKRAKSDYAIAVTGVAGPGADSQGHEQGLVYIAVCDRKKVWVKELHIGHAGSSREFIREVTSKNALDMLRLFVLGEDSGAVPFNKTKKREKKPFLSSVIPHKNDGQSVVFKKISRLVIILLLILALVIGAVSSFGTVLRIFESRRLLSVYSKALYDPENPVDENGFDTRLSTLIEKNPDTVGWLWIDGTTLSYPVMRGEKYSQTGFDKKGSAPYVNESADFRAAMQNILINSDKEGTENPLFEIKNYKSLSFYKSHPVINLVSTAGESEWKVFGVFLAGSDFEYYNYPKFLNSEELYFYVDCVRARSIIDTAVDIRDGDVLMTLSIPANDFEGAKLVVAARKVRRAETDFSESERAKLNLTPLYPDEYYEENGGKRPDFSALLGADDVMSEEDNAETVPVESISSETSSLEDFSSDFESSQITSSEVTSSSFTSHEESSYFEESSDDEESSEEEISSSKNTSSRVTSSRVTSSKVTSSKETSSKVTSSKVTSSEVTSSKHTSSAVTSSRYVSSALVSSEVTSSKDEVVTPPPVVDTSVLKVNAGGRIISGSAYDIVCQIVANEIGSTTEREAIKAQAVAAHTYVLFYNQTGQVPYVALKTPNALVKSAVAEVIDERIYYNGALAMSCYGSMSAGKTNASSEVWGGHYNYLVSVDSEYDHLAPNYMAEKQYSSQYVGDKIRQKLKISLKGDPNEWFEVVSYTSGGYNDIVRVGGQTTFKNGNKTQNITGRYLRENVLSLRSACFDIEYDADSDTFTFTTYGYGHGVGLSQWGAIFYAQKEGWDYKDILTHYFTGCEVY